MTDDTILRSRILLLKEELEKGNVVFSPHVMEDFKNSMSAVRYGPDGLVDLSTVDSRVRALALAISHMKERREAKNEISIKEIQEIYFKYVYKNFGWLYEEMKKSDLNPQSISFMACRTNELSSKIYPKISEFIKGLEEFWRAVYDPISYHVQDLTAMKGVFGGDLFPSYKHNIASSCGIYLDTIIIDDPFLRSAELFKRFPQKEAVQILVKHAMSVLSYMELALSDVDIPVVIIVPDRLKIHKDEEEAFLIKCSEPDALKHAGLIFGREFDSMEDVFEFCKRLNTPEDLIKKVVDKTRLLFDMDWVDPLEIQITRAAGMVDDFGFSDNIENLVPLMCSGRMRQATDLLMKSRYWDGVPLIQAGTSWRYFDWKLQYNAAQAPGNPKLLHIARGLQQAGETEMEWLGNIPVSSLIEIRKQGALEEIRHAISHNIRDINSLESADFLKTSDQIVRNLREGVRKHREAVEKIRQSNKHFWLHDIGAWIVTGSIELAAIVTGRVDLGVAGFALNQALAPTDLKELPSRFKKLGEEKLALRKSPAGLLFRNSKP